MSPDVKFTIALVLLGAALVVVWKYQQNPNTIQERAINQSNEEVGFDSSSAPGVNQIGASSVQNIFPSPDGMAL